MIEYGIRMCRSLFLFTFLMLCQCGFSQSYAQENFNWTDIEARATAGSKQIDYTYPSDYPPPWGFPLSISDNFASSYAEAKVGFGNIYCKVNSNSHVRYMSNSRFNGKFDYSGPILIKVRNNYSHQGGGGSVVSFLTFIRSIRSLK